MERVVVHIVDDDREILDSVSFMLGTEGIETTTHISSEAFLARLPDLAMGCILLDVRMPGMNGIELQKHLHACGCRMPVIIVTGHGDVSTAVSAMKEGAIDFIQKPFAKADLIAALTSARENMAMPASDTDERRMAQDMLARLTPRERQVVEGLVKGHANKVIAFDLGISPRTIELYRSNAMHKLEVRSLSEMLHLAFVAGVAAG
jgi:two-component system response regulator FixJ